MSIQSSVALCTYNGEDYILEQLESINTQTIAPTEIVICDDCSNDKTVQLIKEFSEQTPIRMKIVVNESNLGFRKNFEKCMDLCSGDVVFYCDQDDVWLNNKLEKMLEVFENKGVVLCFSDGYVTDEKINVIADSEWSVNWSNMNK